MTTKDRILCAFGFHDRLEKTGNKVEAWSSVQQKNIVVGQLFRCTVCGREKTLCV